MLGTQRSLLRPRAAPIFSEKVPLGGLTASYYPNQFHAYTDSQSIATWEDSTENRYDLTQATVGSRLAWGVTEQAVISGGGQLMTNASVPYDRRSLSVLWVGSLFTVESDSNRLVSFNGLGLILRILEGCISVWRGSNTSTTFRPLCYQRIAILMTCSASGVSIYVDDAANVQSISANGASTGTQFEIGNTVSGSAAQNVDEIHIWPFALDVTQAGQVLDYAAAKYSTGKVAASSPTGHVIIDGDSVAHGVGHTLNRRWGPALGPFGGWWPHNFGVTSQRLDQMDDDAGTDINTPFANSTNWLLVLAGNNDLSAGDSGATVDSELAAYCNAAITAGFDKSHIVVFTLTTSNVFSGRRDDANTAIRANYTSYAGWLVDVAADANLGVTPGGGFLNSSYFVDAFHMNSAGQALLAALVKSTVTLPWE